MAAPLSVPPLPVPPPKQNPLLVALVQRLHGHVASVTAAHPEAWKQVASFREAKGSKGIGDWPNWCFLPLSGAYAIATGGRDDVPVNGSEVGAIGALAAWRITKGIYRFDPTVLDELWATPVTGDIPSEILQRLPEWCCYVALDPPRKAFADMPDIRGFFVHLEHDQKDKRMELRFLLDFDDDRGPHLTSIPLHIAGTIDESIKAALDETLRQARTNGTRDNRPEMDIERAIAILRERWITELPPLVSLVLYLCSTTAEVIPAKGYRPPLRHAKKGSKLFAAQEPVVWEVAYRLGQVLRQAAAQEPARCEQGGSHARPRPHIRRAHWHGFWTGPKAAVGVAKETKREIVLKWIPPTPVNAGNADDVIPAVHRVTR